MPVVGIHGSASAEAEEAAARYDRERTGLGTDFRNELGTALQTLREGLNSGSPWPGDPGERGVRRLLFKRFPFQLVFLYRVTGILVIAVAHQARRPNYWSHRLTD
jgi:plasmid stabilization system protein ParE